MQNPYFLLEQLGLSEAEASAYLALLNGARDAREIIKTTRMKRPTVYYALSMLERRALISRTGQDNEKRILVEPAGRLKTLIETKERELKLLGKNIDGLISAFARGEKKDIKPSVHFYEGLEAVQNVIMESVYAKSNQIRVIAPHNNFFRQVGDDFLNSYLEERNRRGIIVKSLWEKPVDKIIYKRYYARSEVRLLPVVMHDKFPTTIFLYDDKTLYISSLKNAYCILIISQEHHDTIGACFEGLWISSTVHPT
ncbi:MAG: helix-turn-helix domain-containing protein [Patescibacteria group bacterium]